VLGLQFAFVLINRS